MAEQQDLSLSDQLEQLVQYLEKPAKQIWLSPEWLIMENSEWMPSGLGVWLVPFYEAALGALVLLGCFALIRLFFPKLAAVAGTTAKEALSQPLFFVLLFAGIFLLVIVFPFLPYNTFGEDVKVLKDNGLVVIKVLSILLAVWTASVSISEEIEGRTAVTLLSKPVSRRDFVLGKLAGIVGAVAVMFLILGAVFLLMIGYKVGYDARDNVQQVTAFSRLNEMTLVIPGLLLSFYEAVIFTAIGVAISTRLPMLANLVICGAVYALGHLMPVVVESSGGLPEVVQFLARLLAAVLPNLDHFNMEAAVATGREVPLVVMIFTGLYALIYTTSMAFLALLMFEDRDLA